MQSRSFGLVTLAVASVMVALHAQLAAIALLLGGSVFTTLGSIEGAAALLLGALYFAVALVAYAVGYGAWTRKPWTWNAGVVVFVMLAVATVLLVALSGKLLAAPLPLAGTILGIAILMRPSTRAGLLGATAGAADRGAARATDATGVVGAVR